ncbi:MAG: energy transducer TonB [Sulfurimonas sp.]
MNSKAGLFASFIIVVMFHTYLLSSYKVEQIHIAVPSDTKVSTVINLQKACIKGSESEDESLNDETLPEPVPEETIPKPEPLIEKKMPKIPKPIKKEKLTKKKKIIKKKKKMVKKRKRATSHRGNSTSGSLSGGQISGPGGTFRENYFSTVWKMIERKKRYPSVAKKMHQEGVVHLSFTIGKDGRIRNIGLAKKSPYRRLNNAALRILKEIGSFPPIPKKLKKSSLSIIVPVRYKIKLN